MRRVILVLPALAAAGCGTDTRPGGPIVTATVPADGAAGVPLMPEIAVTFSKEMEPDSITAATSGMACTGTIQLSEDDFVTCVPAEDPPETDDGRTFLLRPSAPLDALATYKLRVTRDARSTRGFQLERAFEMDDGFTTADAPAVVATVPEDGAVGVLASSLSVTFSREMNPDTITTSTTSDACAGTVRVSRDGFVTCLRMATQPESADGVTFTLTPVEALASATTYEIRVTADAEDTEGNPIGQVWTSPEGFVTRYFHTIVIDGTNDFDAGNERLDTSSTGSGYHGWIAWDRDNLYVGMSGADVGGGSPTRFLLIYLGTGGTTTGLQYNTQAPALPFAARWHVRWKADNSFTDAQAWNGSSWVDAGWNATAFQSGTFVELSIPLASLGSPATLPIHLSMINEGSGVEFTFAGVPATSFADAYDPDYAQALMLDLAGSTVPSAQPVEP